MAQKNLIVGYGNLYNGYVDFSKIAPVGCRVCTDTDTSTLSSYLGDDSSSGQKLKSRRISPLACGWNYNAGNVGNNISKFNGLPGGYRQTTGTFSNVNNYGYFWTSTVKDTTSNYYRVLYYNGLNFYRNSINKLNGFSIRCLLSDPTKWKSGQIITDIDGNEYGTVQIGNQVWLTSNLKVTRYNDGTAIPNVTDNTAWSNLTTGAYCTYNNAALVEYTEKGDIVKQKTYQAVESVRKPIVDKRDTVIAHYTFNRNYLDLKGFKNGTNTKCSFTKAGIKLNGTDSKVVLGAIGNCKSIAFRIKLGSTTEKIGEGATNGLFIHVATGTLAYSDFDNCFIDGIDSDTIVANQWHNVVITSTTNVNLTNFTLGLNNATYGNFEIRDLVFFNTELTLSQAKQYHNQFYIPSLTEDFSDGQINTKMKNWQKGSGTYNVVKIDKATSVDGETEYAYKCTVAGTTAIPCKVAYGTWEFDVYQYTGNNTEVSFVADTIRIPGGSPGITGFTIRILSTGQLLISRLNNGSRVVITTTNSGYITPLIFYRIKIIRTKAGVFTSYIKGGSFGKNYVLISNAGGGNNPATDATITTPRYITLDLDANDMIANIKVYDQIYEG